MTSAQHEKAYEVWSKPSGSISLLVLGKMSQTKECKAKYTLERKCDNHNSMKTLREQGKA